MTSGKLSCKEAVELVTDYLEEALLPEMEARFTGHIETCPGCTLYVDQMRQTLRALRHLTDETTPVGEKTALLHLFQTWQKNQAPHSHSAQEFDKS